MSSGAKTIYKWLKNRAGLTSRAEDQGLIDDVWLSLHSLDELKTLGLVREKQAIVVEFQDGSKITLYLRHYRPDDLPPVDWGSDYAQ